jgi:uncharacterized membrane protein
VRFHTPRRAARLIVNRELLASRAGRLVAGALGVLVLTVLVGVIALWPSGDRGFRAIAIATATERATVERVTRRTCAQGTNTPCQILGVRVESGPDAGAFVTMTMPGTDYAPAIYVGDRIRIVRSDPTYGSGTSAAQAAQLGAEPYSFADFERRRPLYLLAALFFLVVVALARFKGVRALVGLGLSLVVVTQFMVPAILEGSSALLVALVGSLAVMLLTVTLAHGTGVTSIAAILGASASLLATALLATLFVGLAQITGFSSEEATLLSSATGRDLSLQGLVLAGIVVGALGVLDDVTVSQASTVLALRRANPLQGFRRLFREALSVGRDHLSATVNTLVLAYVGAALPLLLIFENQGTTFGEAINREVVASEIVAMLVGSIGLVLAVPLTTALAAWLARGLPATALPAEAHHHH